MSFDTKCVPDELIPYMGLLGSTLSLMDTKNYTYPELTNEININCGGLATGTALRLILVRIQLYMRLRVRHYMRKFHLFLV